MGTKESVTAIVLPTPDFAFKLLMPATVCGRFLFRVDNENNPFEKKTGRLLIEPACFLFITIRFW